MGWRRGEPCRVVKCNDCGYLGRLAKNGADLPLLEYVAETRRIESNYRHGAPAWCFKGRIEFQRIDNFLLDTADVLREHDCPEFVSYEPGYSPDGLQELLMREELRRIEAARDEYRLAWQKEEERERRDWQKDIEDGHRFDRRLIGGATLLVLIASVVVTALAATGGLRPSYPSPPSSPSAGFVVSLPFGEPPERGTAVVVPVLADPDKPGPAAKHVFRGEERPDLVLAALVRPD